MAVIAALRFTDNRHREPLLGPPIYGPRRGLLSVLAQPSCLTIALSTAGGDNVSAHAITACLPRLTKRPARAAMTGFISKGIFALDTPTCARAENARSSVVAHQGTTTAIFAGLSDSAGYPASTTIIGVVHKILARARATALTELTLRLAVTSGITSLTRATYVATRATVIWIGQGRALAIAEAFPCRAHARAILTNLSASAGDTAATTVLGVRLKVYVWINYTAS